MGKATEQALADLHGAVAGALTDVIQNGQVVGVTDAGEPIKATAGAAFFAAAITMLKNNNITADAGLNEGLADLTAALKRKREEGKKKMADVSGAGRATAVEQLERELGGMLPE